jgi:hypothetical protein
MAEIEKINNEELEKVDGGMANAYQTLKKRCCWNDSARCERKTQNGKRQC